jgi:hypothetical protein
VDGGTFKESTLRKEEQLQTTKRMFQRWWHWILYACAARLPRHLLSCLRFAFQHSVAIWRDGLHSSCYMTAVQVPLKEEIMLASRVLLFEGLLQSEWDLTQEVLELCGQSPSIPCVFPARGGQDGTDETCSASDASERALLKQLLGDTTTTDIKGGGTEEKEAPPKDESTAGLGAFACCDWPAFDDAPNDTRRFAIGWQPHSEFVYAVFEDRVRQFHVPWRSGLERGPVLMSCTDRFTLRHVEPKSPHFSYTSLKVSPAQTVPVKLSIGGIQDRGSLWTVVECERDAFMDLKVSELPCQPRLSMELSNKATHFGLDSVHDGKWFFTEAGPFARVKRLGNKLWSTHMCGHSLRAALWQDEYEGVMGMLMKDATAPGPFCWFLPAIREHAVGFFSALYNGMPFLVVPTWWDLHHLNRGLADWPAPSTAVEALTVRIHVCDPASTARQWVLQETLPPPHDVLDLLETHDVEVSQVRAAGLSRRLETSQKVVLKYAGMKAPVTRLAIWVVYRARLIGQPPKAPCVCIHHCLFHVDMDALLSPLSHGEPDWTWLQYGIRQRDAAQCLVHSLRIPQSMHGDRYASTQESLLPIATRLDACLTSSMSPFTDMVLLIPDLPWRLLNRIFDTPVTSGSSLLPWVPEKPKFHLGYYLAASFRDAVTRLCVWGSSKQVTTHSYFQFLMGLQSAHLEPGIVRMLNHMENADLTTFTSMIEDLILFLEEDATHEVPIAMDPHLGTFWAMFSFLMRARFPWLPAMLRNSSIQRLLFE